MSKLPGLGTQLSNVSPTGEATEESLASSATSRNVLARLKPAGCSLSPQLEINKMLGAR